MAANVFGAWSWIFIIAITLATLAIAVPIAVIKALCRLEQAGAFLVGRLQARAWRGNRSLARRSPSGGSHRDLPISSWNHDLRTGNPTGPDGQLDFWNYNPATGAKFADSKPNVPQEDLPELWSAGR